LGGSAASAPVETMAMAMNARVILRLGIDGYLGSVTIEVGILQRKPAASDAGKKCFLTTEVTESTEEKWIMDNG